MNPDGNLLRGVLIGLGLEVAFLEMIYVVYLTGCLIKQWVN